MERNLENVSELYRKLNKTKTYKRETRVFEFRSDFVERSSKNLDATGIPQQKLLHLDGVH